MRAVLVLWASSVRGIFGRVPGGRGGDGRRRLSGDPGW